MNLSGRYFHVYVFAAFFIGLSVSVASNPKAFVDGLRPAVSDAVELIEGADAYVRRFDPQGAARDVMDIYALTLRQPSDLFERIHEALVRARRRMHR